MPSSATATTATTSSSGSGPWTRRWPACRRTRGPASCCARSGTDSSRPWAAPRVRCTARPSSKPGSGPGTPRRSTRRPSRRCSTPRPTGWPGAAVVGSATRRSSTRSRRPPRRSGRRSESGRRRRRPTALPCRAGVPRDAPHARPRRAPRPGDAPRRTVRRPPGPGRGLVPAPPVRAGGSMTDRRRAAGPDRGTRAGESPGVRRRPARSRCAVRPVPAQPARRVGRVARRPRPVRGPRSRPPGGRRRRRAVAERCPTNPAFGAWRWSGATSLAASPRPSMGRRMAGSGPPVSRAAGPSPSPTSHRSSCSGSGPTTDARRTRTASGSSSWPATSWRSRSRRRGCARSLERERQELTAVVSGTTDLILQVDAERQVVRLNPAGERLLGMAAADALGRTCAEVLGCDVSGGHDRGGLPARRGHGHRPADRLSRDRRARRRWQLGPGRRRLLHGRPRVPDAGDGQGQARATAVVRDISAVRALEELREGFVATVSHELRTPLSLIRGYTETLLHLDLTPEEQRDYVGRIDEVTGRLSALVGQILDVTHLQADPLILERAPRPVRLAREPAAGRSRVDGSRGPTRGRTCRTTCRHSTSTDRGSARSWRTSSATPSSTGRRTGS